MLVANHSQNCGYHFSSRLTATLNLCVIYFKITLALAILLEHMHKKFRIKRTKIKGGCQSRRKAGTHNSKSDLPLVSTSHLLRRGYTLQLSAVLCYAVQWCTWQSQAIVTSVELKALKRITNTIHLRLSFPRSIMYVLT